MNKIANLSPHAHWFLRLGLASVFLYHGVDKFVRLEEIAGMMQMSEIMISLLGAVEIGGVLFLIAGGIGKELLTRLAGLAFATVMIGAIATVHFKNGWNSIGLTVLKFPPMTPFPCLDGPTPTIRIERSRKRLGRTTAGRTVVHLRRS